MKAVAYLHVALRSLATACWVPIRRLLRGPARPSWSVGEEIAIGVMRGALPLTLRYGFDWLRTVQRVSPQRSPFVDRAAFERVDAGGVPAEWCTPRDGDPTRTLVYLHGGGYVIGNVAGYRELLARLAVSAGARVLGVDYRLSPESAFPAAQDDCLTATRWVLAQGADPARLALAGDSAGGALAVATLASLRDAGDPLPAAGVLICPWTDPWATTGSMQTNAHWDFADASLLTSWIARHVPAERGRDPRVAVVDAKLDGLPPLLVHAGEVEVLHDQILQLVERARAAGVDVRLTVFPDMFHVFHLLAPRFSRAAAAVEEIARYLRERLPE